MAGKTKDAHEARDVYVSRVDALARWEYVRREYDYWWRQYKRRWRGTIVVNVANPLLFLIAIGAGIGRLVTPSTDSAAAAALGGVTYLAFFAPGMLAAAAMQNGIIEGAQAVRGRMPDGPYQPAITSPLEPVDILLGHVLYMAVRVGLSAAAFILVMVAMGAAHSWLVVLALPAATLTGLAFATPTAAWGATVDDPGRVNDLFKWVVMPMYLFSGTFFATNQLPEWAQAVVAVTPLWHGVELCRTLSLGTATWAGSAVHAGYLVAVAVLGVMLAARTFRTHLHR